MLEPRVQQIEEYDSAASVRRFADVPPGEISITVVTARYRGSEVSIYQYLQVRD